MRGILMCVLILVVAVSVGLQGVSEQGKPIPPEEMIPTLETALQQLAEEAQQTLTQAETLARELGMVWREGHVRVVVETDGPLSTSEIMRLGGEVLSRADALNMLEVEIPAVCLIELARLTGVRFVRRPYRPVPLVVSEGVELSGAQAWQQAGYRGQGIRVAVIDGGFDGLTEALSSGELAHVTFTHDYTGEGLETDSVHGTACAEIVHDMAPAAELLLMKIDSDVDLANAVSDAISHGVNVITHSMGWFNTNFYDGTGLIPEIVAQAVDSGILWVNSAGNSADGGHWEGNWQDADADGWLDFAPLDEENGFYLEMGETIGLYLTWDGWPSSDQDYDLFLVNGVGDIVASSENYQGGTQEPSEIIEYTAPASDNYGVAIQVYSAPAHPRMELFCKPYDLPLEYSVECSSIAAPANAPFVFAVGAIDWKDWETGPQEPFSSQGPTNNSQHAASITKPDICGADGVSGMSYETAFYGTSAASPQVAGAAALLWSKYPSWSATGVREWLESNAVDIGTSGKDNLYGYGRLHLPFGVTPGNTHTYGAAPGWYMASVPLNGGSSSNLYGTAAYRWNPATGEYDLATMIEPAEGYWVYLPASKVVTDSGDQVTSDVTLNISTAGWHQISAPWLYPKSEIQVTRECRTCGGTTTQTKTWADAAAAGWVRDAIYGYKATDGAYNTPSTLDPWYGYWVRAEVSGLSLKLNYASGTPVSATFAPMAPKALVVPADLPPMPKASSLELATLRVVNIPNPLTTELATTFWVQGVCLCIVQGLRVEVYDLAGRLVWQGETDIPGLPWFTHDTLGEYLSNGVYLYRAQVKISGEWVTTPQGKLVILR